MTRNYALSTAVAVGDGNHATLHNTTNTAVNDLDARAIAIEDESIFIPAGRFALNSGSPALSAALPQLWPMWLLDPSGTEIVSTVVKAPVGWATAQLYVHWGTPVSSASGDVVFQARCYPEKASGGTITGEVTLTNLTVTTGATQYSVFRTAIGAAITCSATPAALPRPLLGMSLRRIGGDAADTYVNDIGFLGFEMVKLS
jgi:hypothetical protein